ncbi:MAG: excalibur calcium-binding domain-containing protein [Candidatus Nanopelagicales bacterium]
MKKVIASVLAGLTIGAPMALAFSSPAQAAPYKAAPYKNCTQAKQNGDCDIPSSSDKYQSKLDRDGDGLGCEC